MGSWSVSCGISKIAITAGQKCVLVPLRKNKGDYGYFEYIPAMLPIFGEYDDYGGIENIEKNLNTKLIEKVTGITVEEFCSFLVDGEYTYDRDEAKEIASKLKNLEVMKTIRFMWMDREVFDFMTTHSNSDGLMGSMGFPFVLRHFGFERIKDFDKSEGRYKKAWFKNGKKVFSDGQWIETENGKTIYAINASYYTDGNLKYHFDLTTEELSWQNKNLYHYYEDMNQQEARKHLLRVLSDKDYEFDRIIDYANLIEKYTEDGDEEMVSMIKRIQSEKKTNLSIFHKEYYEDIMKFKKDLAGIGILYSNMHCMSGNFIPHELYLTPQCGEYKDHQVLLEKFAEINKKHIYDEDED